MTLYTYVPGKAELLDLMLDEAYGLMPRTPHAAGAPWRATCPPTARAALEAAVTGGETAQSDEEWWATHESLPARVFDPARYPLAARVGSAAGEAHGAAYDPGHAYEFGLQRVLDGFAALVTARAGAQTFRPRLRFRRPRHRRRRIRRPRRGGVRRRTRPRRCRPSRWGHRAT